MSAVERLGASTVGELARAGASRITGVGASVRRELRHLVTRLRDAGLAEEPEALGDLDEREVAVLAVDGLAERLVPQSNLPDERRRVLLTLLGLHGEARDDVGTWPTRTATAEATGAALAQVSSELDRARRRWAEHRPELVVVRTEIAA